MLYVFIILTKKRREYIDKNLVILKFDETVEYLWDKSVVVTNCKSN